MHERGDRLVSLRVLLLCLTGLVVGCASTQEQIVRQLVHDNGADKGTFGWYHDVKALGEFEVEARDCADHYRSNPALLKRATVTASITECLIEKGWRLDGLWEIVVR